MSAQLQEQPPLFNVDQIHGKHVRPYVRFASLQDAKRAAENIREGYRLYRADREKPLALKLAHSNRPSRASGEAANRSIREKAEMMAEHIIRTRQTLVPLFHGRYHELREFNAALCRALGNYVYWIVDVDPAKDVTSHED